MQIHLEQQMYKKAPEEAVKIFAKVPYPQHYDTGCLDEESLGCIGLGLR